MVGNKRTRLQKAQAKVKPQREIVVFWNDYDNLHTYDSPPDEPGAREVTEEEIELASQTKTVFVVTYAPYGVVPGKG